jgi:antirestriction protein ArdC
MGGSVNQGEHGHIVVFWKQLPKKGQDEQSEEGQKKHVPMLRYYKVFNISQCRDIPPNLIPAVDKGISEIDCNLECETIIRSMPMAPVITHKEQRAYYDPASDIVNMPKKKSFKALESYYSTLFHELVHSTGSEKRLGRKTLKDMVAFGAESYALEELIAEIGSAYLCRFAGILPNEINNAVAYIDGWLDVFKNDKRFIITASGQAQKAADFILNRQDNDAKEELQSVDESVTN